MRVRRDAAARNPFAPPPVPTREEDPLVESDADEADEAGEPCPAILEDDSSGDTDEEDEEDVDDPAVERAEVEAAVLGLDVLDTTPTNVDDQSMAPPADKRRLDRAADMSRDEITALRWELYKMTVPEYIQDLF